MQREAGCQKGEVFRPLDTRVILEKHAGDRATSLIPLVARPQPRNSPRRPDPVGGAWHQPAVWHSEHRPLPYADNPSQQTSAPRTLMKPPPRLLPAYPAVPMSRTRMQVGIFLSKRVSVITLSLARIHSIWAYTPQRVHLVRDDFKMRGAHTRGIPTEMVKLHSGWNRAFRKLKGISMSERKSMIDIKPTVPFRVNPSDIDPTVGGLVYFTPKPLYIIAHDSCGDRDILPYIASSPPSHVVRLTQALGVDRSSAACYCALHIVIIPQMRPKLIASSIQRNSLTSIPPCQSFGSRSS